MTDCCCLFVQQLLLKLIRLWIDITRRTLLLLASKESVRVKYADCEHLIQSGQRIECITFTTAAGALLTVNN